MASTATWIHLPKQPRSKNTLSRIVKATRSLLDEKSFDNLTISEIMHRAGMSVGAFYTRFPNKEALLPYLYDRYDKELASHLENELQPERWDHLDLAQRIAQLVHLSVKTYRRSKGLYRAMLIHASRNPREISSTYKKRRRKMVEQLTTLLLARRQEISHPTPENAVEFVLIFLFATCKDKILLEEANHGTLPTTDAQLQIELVRSLTSYLGVKD